MDGPALTASITPTSILHATGKFQFLPNAFQIGTVLVLRAAGRISNIAVAPGTLKLDVRGQGIVIADGGAMALNTTAKTDVPWWLWWMLTCRATGPGTSANFAHQGLWTSESVVGSPLPSAGGAGTH